MNKIFLIADTHFDHRNIITYCNRPWTNTEDMNRDMVARWNAAVEPTDKVYHLGDVALGKNGLAVARQLNGRKILIKGNHDYRDLKEYTTIFADIRAAHELGKLLLTHFPVDYGQHERYERNIHGHLHEKIITFPDGSPNPWYFSVSVERINYTPILFEDMVKQFT